MNAIWQGRVMAESGDTISVEGNHHFPPSALDRTYLAWGTKPTTCSWKDRANCYHVVVNEEVSENAAWHYSDPKPAAARIPDDVAFFPGMNLVD